VTALDGVDLEVDRGEVFGLLGPNGAGKTTQVRQITGELAPTSGSVRVLGVDVVREPQRAKGLMGVVPQEAVPYPHLNAREHLSLFGRLHGLSAGRARERAETLIEALGLQEHAKKPSIQLSGGLKRKLLVGNALVAEPPVLVLDEPTTGFDPGARRNAWEIVRNLAALRKTVFLTTHYMDEAQSLANRVAVISRGVIVAEGPPSTLGDRHLAETIVRFRLPQGVVGVPDWGQVATSDGTLELRSADPTRTLHEITAWALERNVRLEALDVSRPSLEDVYLELTGEFAGPGGRE